MNADEFRAWRKRLALTQEQAGAELNRTRRQIIAYEDGSADVPREIKLACAALEIGPLSIIRRKAGD